MTESDRRDPDAEAPGTPVSRLSAAVLRISASLDLDTVLREVVESARALTGARLGVIAPVDEAGLPQGHVASGPDRGGGTADGGLARRDAPV